MIRIQGLHKYFNKGRQNELHVIDGVDLTFPERGMVAIFGKSGCGKTTLLNVIGGLDGFAAGSLSVDGKDIRRHTDLIRNQYVGYIFQNYNLNKERTCYDNVADALRLCGMKDGPEMERRVRTALANVDMEKYAARTPDTLSGGQQQRIAIARAIVKNPKIILADEPTGNLDESNTLMIMDLLKQISKDHLVLLVTHEADLVDYYCDTVIELKDGRVESVRENESAVGMMARDKNHIYLGELSRSELSDGNARVEYYGDTPETPISLRIVNRNGKFYVQIGTAGVQVLDAFSEVKLKEGVFNAAPEEREKKEKNIDMSALPPVEGSRYGRLFHWGGSIQSGYASNFKNQKKGKRFLRACLCLFAAVVVFATAAFGTAFGDLIEAKESYNHNTFYLYTPTGEVSDALLNALGKADSGIDALYLKSGVPQGDQTVKFMTGYFETFSTVSYDESFRTNAVYLPTRLSEGAELLAGNNKNLADHDLLITEQVANALLECSSVDYIREVDDLVGLVARGISVSGANARIAGVVKGNENAVYVSDAYLEEQALSHLSNVYAADDFGLAATSGEVILAIRERDSAVKYPSVGETVTIHGKELTVARIVERPEHYDTWVKTKDPSLTRDAYEYYLAEAETEFDPSVLTEEWMTKESWIEARAWELTEQFRYEYYERYYQHMEEYAELCFLFSSDSANRWIRNEMGSDEILYSLCSAHEYYRVVKFREAYGRYPDQTKADEDRMEQIPDLHEVIQPYQDLYYSLDKEYETDGILRQSVSFLLHEEDLHSLAYRFGENHELVQAESAMNYNYYEGDYGVIYEESVEIGSSSSSIGVMPTMYTVIHSSDPEQTSAFLSETFADLPTPSGSAPKLLTPDDLYDRHMAQNGRKILTGSITVVVILALMSVCMYFIMRSSLMNRIKEVGIYRAIGVSKKNLCFRFLVEALVLTTLTVLIGYAVSSAILALLLSGSSLMSGMLYYPLWLAAAVFAVLYLICSICGVLPILSLTRKTPSQILAKYDI